MLSLSTVVSSAADHHYNQDPLLCTSGILMQRWSTANCERAMVVEVELEAADNRAVEEARAPSWLGVWA